MDHLTKYCDLHRAAAVLWHADPLEVPYLVYADLLRHSSMEQT